MTEHNALYYEHFVFYSTGGNDRFDQCLLDSKLSFEFVFVSIDKGPAKRLLDLKWNDFDESSKNLLISGGPENGQISAGRTKFAFKNEELSFATFGPSETVGLSGSVGGPFVLLHATRKQIESAFGKPKKTGFANVHAP